MNSHFGECGRRSGQVERCRRLTAATVPKLPGRRGDRMVLRTPTSATATTGSFSTRNRGCSRPRPWAGPHSARLVAVLVPLHAIFHSLAVSACRQYGNALPIQVEQSTSLPVFIERSSMFIDQSMVAKLQNLAREIL
jgi:hypothetical protein